MSRRVKKPSAQDLFLAAQWLEVYEGAEDAFACRRVAEWLRYQSDLEDLREACKGAGVSVAEFRRAKKIRGEK